MSDNRRIYSDSIKKKAKELNFTSCRIAKATFLEEEAPRLEQWLKNDYEGEMSYMQNHFDKRLDPRELVEGAQTVISLSYNYFPDQKQTESTYKIAKYAYGQDYHHVVKAKLSELLEFINQEIGEVHGRVFVDSAPVLEKAWAKRSGVGWLGKNSNLIIKKQGSFFFLAELIIDLALAEDSAVTDHCGQCTRCIDACPTQAIIQPYVVNASQCISYFTIELKEEIPQGHDFDDWIFGCDICQDVCPWNRFSVPHSDTMLKPQENWQDYTKNDWKEITQEVFSDIFKKSAVKRTRYAGFIRNINYVKQRQKR